MPFAEASPRSKVDDESLVIHTESSTTKNGTYHTSHNEVDQLLHVPKTARQVDLLDNHAEVTVRSALLMFLYAQPLFMVADIWVTCSRAIAAGGGRYEVNDCQIAPRRVQRGTWARR